MINNRDDCAKFLVGARNKANGRPIAKNLRVFERENGDYAIRYHWTDIVTFHANGDITLRNGGHYTSSTKTNINSFSRVLVWQKDFSWYVTLNGRKLPFRDGMRIDPFTDRIVN